MERQGVGCVGGGGAQGGISHSFLNQATAIPAPDTLQHLWSLFNQGTGPGEGGSCTARNRSSGAGSFRRARFLQPSFRCSKSFGGVASYFRPKTPEQVCRQDQVQDGDGPVGPLCNKEERLDDLHRPERCIFANTGSPGEQEIPQICHQQRSIPISDPMLRAVYSPTGLHSSDGPNISDSSQHGSPPSKISRRLVGTDIIQGGMPSSKETSNGSLQRTWDSHKYREIIPDTIPRDDIPRYDNQLPDFEGFPHNRETEESIINYRRISLLKKSASFTLAKDIGTPIIPESTSPREQAENEVSTISTSETMEFQGRRSADLLESTVSGGPLVVDREQSTSGGLFPAGATTRPRILVRCLGQGLGSTSGKPFHIRPMVRRGEDDVDKQKRTKSSKIRTSEFSRISSGQSSSHIHRQHDSSSIPKEPGGDSVPKPQRRSPKDSKMGRRSQSSTTPTVSSRFPECYSRLVVKAKPDTRSGMDSVPGNCRPTIEEVAGNNRSVCNIPQLSTSSLLRSPQGPLECRDGLSASEMGQHPRICLSTIPSHQESFEQNSTVDEARSDVDSPFLASEGVVPGSAGITSGTTPSIAREERSTQTASFPQIPPEPPRATPSCVATFQRFARHEGFSPRVAKQLALARRRSTNMMYQQKWSVYRGWCRKKGVSVSRPTLPKVAEFLLELQKKRNLTVSSIKGYRSMLAYVFRLKLPEISSSPILKDLIRSFSLESKKTLSPPTWDLNKVLMSLMSPPFEPLREVSLRNLTKKTLFLLSLASVKRIGEIQSISANVARRGINLSLSYLPEFVAKTESEANPIPRHFIVEALSEFAAGLEEGSLLCPVRAIQYYLERTGKVQNRPRNLFISPKKPQRPISKNAISFFLRETISESGALVEEGGQRPRAHSIRSVGTSMSFWRNWSMTKVLEAATWKTNTVFTSFYLKDVEFIFENCRRLGPFLSGGEIMNTDNT